MSDFHAGFGAHNYTPEPPNNAFEIFDPIYFRALILKEGDTNVTFLSGDVFSIEADLLERVKMRLQQIEWLNLNHILPCASHIGTAPILFQSYVNQPCEALKFYGREDEFADHMATAIQKAAQSLHPARIGFGSQPASGILYNRRSYNEDGKLIMSNFKFPYPRPELTYGPTDDNVYALRIDDADGQPQHCATIFGCHALCNTDKYGNISADYPGIVRSVIESAGIDALFLPGSIGNVVPVSRGGRTYKRLGHSVGGTALYALEQTETTATPNFSITQKTLQVPTFPHPELSESETVLSNTATTSDGRQRFQFYGSRHRADGRTTMDYTLTCIRFGNAQLIHLPGEIFVETARAIKDAADNRLTAVLSGPSADIGYLSPAQAHQEGGMEPQFAGLAVEAENLIREAACELAQ